MVPWQRTTTLHTRLRWIIVPALFGLATLASLTSGWIISAMLERFAANYVTSIAEQLGANSTFSFLAAQSTPALRALQPTRTVPGFEYAAFLRDDSSVIAQVGHTPAWRPKAIATTQTVAPSTLHVQDGLWHVLSPVYLRSTVTRETLEERPADNELLGFVQFTWNRSLLSAATLSIVGVNLLVALALGMLASVWAQRTLEHLTRPLTRLAQALRKAEQARDLLEVNAEGPAEFHEMALAYNALIATINAHTTHLSMEVDTRTKALQQALLDAQAAANVKSDFLAMVSHDMRTPLYAITGYSQLASEELPSDNEIVPKRLLLEACERTRKHLKGVDVAAVGLLSSIGRLLDFSSLEANTTTLNLVQIDLHDMTLQVVETVRFLALDNDNTLTTQVAPGPPFSTDGEKLRHIVSELLTNACKFTHHGLITLTASVHDHTLTIVIEDTGEGIPPDQIPLVFEPFRQGPLLNGGRRPGTGLGLAIAKQYSQLLNGQLDVTSVLTKGSRFCLTIPVTVHGAT